MPETETKFDVQIADAGSIVLVTPLSHAAREWVDANVNLESWQWMGPAFACEPRYVSDLVTGMQEDGLTVSQ